MEWWTTIGQISWNRMATCEVFFTLHSQPVPRFSVSPQTDGKLFSMEWWTTIGEICWKRMDTIGKTSNRIVKFGEALLPGPIGYSRKDLFLFFYVAWLSQGHYISGCSLLPRIDHFLRRKNVYSSVTSDGNYLVRLLNCAFNRRLRDWIFQALCLCLPDWLSLLLFWRCSFFQSQFVLVCILSYSTIRSRLNGRRLSKTYVEDGFLWRRITVIMRLHSWILQNTKSYLGTF